MSESPHVPDITRLFIGAGNEFEVEVVLAGSEDMSPKEPHDFLEYIVVVTGAVILERSDEETPQKHVAPALIELPPGTVHQLDILEDDTKLVIIHPDRTA